VTAPHATLRKLQQNNYGVEYADEYPSVDVVYGAVAGPREDLGTGLAPIDVVTGKRKLLNDGYDSYVDGYDSYAFAGGHAGDEMSPASEDVSPTPNQSPNQSPNQNPNQSPNQSPNHQSPNQEVSELVSMDGYDNYGDWYDPYGVDTDDDYYAGGDGYFYQYLDYYEGEDGSFYQYPAVTVDGVADTAVDVAGDIVSNTVPRSAIDTATGGLGMRKLLQDTSPYHDFSGSLQHVNDNQIAAMGISLGSDSSYSAPSTWSSGDSGGWTEWTEWSNWSSWWG